jgi:hypothetical protein
MVPKNMSSHTLRLPDVEEPVGPACCPICGGRLMPTRGLLRCLLCCFIFCEACEGATASGQSDGGQQ